MKNKCIVIILALILSSRASFAQHWWSLGDGLLGAIHAIEADTVNHILYAGNNGNYTTNGTFTSMLARWNSVNWAPYDSINYQQLEHAIKIHCLKFINGNLYVGGFVDLFGSGLAKWNGTNVVFFDRVHPGSSNDFTNTLIEFNNRIYIAGDFDLVNITFDPANYIAVLNDTTGKWETLGIPPNDGITMSGTNPYTKITGSIVYNNDLYVVGNFDHAAGASIYANGVARWDGTQWYNATDSINGGGFCFELYNGELYKAGGDVQKWNGTTWVTVGTTNGYARAMKVYNGTLIAAGDFTSISGVQANSIAAWDGNSWSALGSGMGGSNTLVECLTVLDGSLYAGGWFDIAGGDTVNHIARWGPAITGVNELTVSNRQLIVAPNPVNQECTITCSISNAAIMLYDITGRILLQQPFNNKAKLDVGNLAAGVYIVEVRDKQGKSIKGKMIKN